MAFIIELISFWWGLLCRDTFFPNFKLQSMFTIKTLLSDYVMVLITLTI